MKDLDKRHVYEFGEFRLDTESRRLVRRGSGESVPLTPRALLLLTTLVCSKGRLLTKEELLDRVWAGSQVEEGNLSQTIFVLRKTLGDNARPPKLILTVPARGYQFIGRVTEVVAKKFDLNSFHRFQNTGSVNLAAYRSYIEGRSFWNKRTKESLKQAIEHFEDAVRQEPDFTYAYAGLAESHKLLAEYYAAALSNVNGDNAGSNRLSGSNDAPLAEAYTTLAYAQAFYDWDWQTAERSFKQALKIDPNYATAHRWYADYLGVIGRFSEARKHIDLAMRLEPDSPAIATTLASYFYTRRDSVNLIKQAKKIIDLAPDFGYGHFYLGFGYEFAGEEAQAVRTWAVAATAFGEPSDCGEELIDAYEQNGMPAVWHKRLDQYETRPHLKNYPPYLKSLVPIRLGDKETSLRWLQEALEKRDRGIIYAKYEPLLKPLRRDPRFQEILSQVGLL